MMKNRLLVFGIILMLLLCSCSQKETDTKIEISPSDKSIIKLASKIYDEQQLSNIAKFGGSLNELNDKYPIECLRKNVNIYRASFLGNDIIAVVAFNNSGKFLFGKTYAVQLSKSDFNEMKKGQSLEDVMATDPNGEYLFLYTGRNDTPRSSSHYTKDGYLITVEYDESNIITNITEELI